MKSLMDYSVITNDTFYKCWNVLDYMEKHPDLSELDKEAIRATIMDALVYSGDINPETDFLSLEELAITNNPEDYHYTKTPNVSSIPMEIKAKLRKKCVYIAGGGIPITMFLAKPPTKFGRYCVYDPNTAFSSIFDDFAFYEALYTSPTRGIRLTETRPFVEVEINGELYLVDTITNRIFKSSHFRETYDLVITDSVRKSEFNKRQKDLYREHTAETTNGLANIIPFYEMMPIMNAPNWAEMRYELEKSKENFPEAWEEARRIQEEMKAFSLFLDKNE